MKEIDLRYLPVAVHAISNKHTCSNSQETEMQEHFCRREDILIPYREKAQKFQKSLEKNRGKTKERKAVHKVREEAFLKKVVSLSFGKIKLDCGEKCRKFTELD